MKKFDFEFVRLVENERRVGPTLASVSRHWGDAPQCFLFVSPHDDDVIIGGSLMILSALTENVPVHIAVVTDGAMGYCSMQEKGTISEIRKKETYAAFETLGVDPANIHWLGYPDCQLANYQGRRAAKKEDPVQSHGFTGLQNGFTELLRKVKPTQIFLPTAADLHPDHRIVHAELLISCFHAPSSIWPELGDPLARTPYLHEMAVYCNFPTPPRLRIRAPGEALQIKLEAIRKFASQTQIASLVRLVEEGGPLEYLRPMLFSLYNPAVYRDMFDAQPELRYIFR